jgi:uncharacterized protein DUF6082
MRINSGKGTGGGMAVLSGATLILGLVGIIVASPWLMSLVADQHKDWSRLSDIGQAYGGISAILSGLALCGVAGSLLLQWHQTRTAQAIGIRERHSDLVKLALTDPDLAWPMVNEASKEHARRVMLLNLWVSHWAMQWDMGVMRKPELRALFEDLFHEDTAVTWWRDYGASWDSNPSRRRRSFLATGHEALFSITGEWPNPGKRPVSTDGLATWGHVAPEVSTSTLAKNDLKPEKP